MSASVIHEGIFLGHVLTVLPSGLAFGRVAGAGHKGLARPSQRGRMYGVTAERGDGGWLT